MTSHPEWDQQTTGTEVVKAFADAIKGKNVVITGVSPGGIGSATALAVASQAPNHLILASRTASKLEEVIADINQKYPGVKAVPVRLDLGSIDSIRDAASKIESLLVGEEINVLINNAGVTDKTRAPITTPDGTRLDKQFFVNHIGTFLLTNLLTPLLQKAAAGSPSGATRVVNVSSHGHRISPIRFSDYALDKYGSDEAIPEAERTHPETPAFLLKGMDDEGFPGFVAYGQSKTANILHATELSRRLKKSGVVAFSIHPGFIETDLDRSLDKEFSDALKAMAANGFKTLDGGAATTLVAAFDPALGQVDVGVEVTGYLSDCQLSEQLVRDHAKDPAIARRLWEETERMLQISK
ncbi:hypothetical protein MCOR27_010220 [Pyricularia oryzae]|uniref:Uncharacterized protein n=4 Tax=Pyricularia TaxID=48558 RepID=A0ABQ8NN24_PYRGI|nr:uncharacterized protein MGG_06553 [Pyricularia oryzae 70-15]ELQ44876.1 retinol dehydrogenase 13 [Pyricularia oryzae Y34]KAH8843601.1 hypothetical protein MCOR01_004395 [Pyricularia oryzae]KAI6299650.1 hypothetical protein MCOR33_004459 [Pyricularia grisea]EHA50669.1 hypothetical protein MGG_06553 [Pyricularia oryzae 70-15]KAH9431075.1 hypothetical protein MCOR02_008384 [Pyricularia oryzae]